MASKCKICGKDTETISHLFLTCPYTTAIWDCLGITFGINLDASVSMASMFEKAIEAFLSTQVFNLWSTAIVSALYAIWFVRNQKHFGNVFIPLVCTLVFIWVLAREANAIQKGTMHNSIGDLLVFRSLGVNTDGAANGCPGLGGCDGYFVTNRGFIKGSFAVPLDSYYAFEMSFNEVDDSRCFSFDYLFRSVWVWRGANLVGMPPSGKVLDERMDCFNEEKVKIAGLLLGRDARRWWVVERSMRQYAWESFKAAFNAQLCLKAYKEAKRMEFERLVEKSMIVTV
ncbi:hypothetical protein FNV43_RR04573 [Rhamnella rubrinervis]|uniref:Reverse transcriptase zinc-binding domain-containing protein n=1 Tax=Rhamnella rubrinervis TaxID=2594499 RepID=A0A8K0HJS9_9ROSA|nr:hypothetical protein FNV43_RR04573 [Rhamnella rubrinervis]